jgi:ubiquinone biosynthesis protein UbiJ
MEGAIDVKLLVTLGGILFSVAGAAAVGKMQIKAIQDTLSDIEQRLRHVDKRLDQLETKMETQHQRVSILSGMMDPSTMERRHRESAKILADIDTLKAAVDKLAHMHNGRHPPIQG